MNHFFVVAYDTREHPIKKLKKKIRVEYITALTYVVEKVIRKVNFRQAETPKYISERLRLYQNHLLTDIIVENIDEKKECVA